MRAKRDCQLPLTVKLGEHDDVRGLRVLIEYSADLAQFIDVIVLAKFHCQRR